MKVLIWTAPWAAHGDPLFYQNCFKKHLVLQGNLLANEGWDVDVFLPELLNTCRADISNKVNVIDFSLDDQVTCFGSLNDLSLPLYKNEDKALTDNIADGLATHLAPHYDIILLWETPVPFLESLYKDALIIHQMPGIFSRPPYPHLVTFDL